MQQFTNLVLPPPTSLQLDGIDNERGKRCANPTLRWVERRWQALLCAFLKVGILKPVSKGV